MPKKWNDIKHQGMTPEQIRAAKNRVLEQKEFVRDVMARLASFRPKLDVIAVADGKIISSTIKRRKTKKEARGGHHGS